MDELAQALAGLAVLKGEMERLSAELPGVLPVRIALPPVSPPINQPPRRKETPPPWAPDEVLRRWRAAGPALLDAPSRRHMSAIIAATAHPEVGPLLAREAVFVQGLAAVASPRQLVPALARMYFYASPAHEHVHVALAAQLKGDGADYAPLWARESTWHLAASATAPRLSVSLGAQIATEPWTTMIQRWGLPDSLPNGPWAEPVVKAAPMDTRQPDALTRATLLLRFADGGVELRDGHSLRPASLAALKRVMQVASVRPDVRMATLSLMRARVGDPFRVTDDARWRGLEEERRQIKAWIAGEVLDLLFTNLRPNNDHRHHTEPRRRFWQHYTQRVERLWLLIDRQMAHRLDEPELRRLKELGVVEVRWLDTTVQQAIVWMHLRNQAGQVITVAEGNANATVRMRSGAWEAPRGTVNYSSDVVHGDLSEVYARTRRHMDGWEQRLRDDLASFGVYP